MIRQKWFWLGVIVPMLTAVLAVAGSTNANGHRGAAGFKCAELPWKRQ